MASSHHPGLYHGTVCRSVLSGQRPRYSFGLCGHCPAYQEQIDELESQNAQLQSEIDTLTAENATQATELDNRQTQIDDLTAKNAEQATELANRQTQIDDLWARVDAAQKNLDAAYAQVEARQTTSSSLGCAALQWAKHFPDRLHHEHWFQIPRAGCQYLRQSQIAISLAKAKAARIYRLFALLLRQKTRPFWTGSSCLSGVDLNGCRSIVNCYSVATQI